MRERNDLPKVKELRNGLKLEVPSFVYMAQNMLDSSKEFKAKCTFMDWITHPIEIYHGDGSVKLHGLRLGLGYHSDLIIYDEAYWMLGMDKLIREGEKRNIDFNNPPEHCYWGEQKLKEEKFELQDKAIKTKPIPLDRNELGECYGYKTLRNGQVLKQYSKTQQKEVDLKIKSKTATVRERNRYLMTTMVNQDLNMRNKDENVVVRFGFEVSRWLDDMGWMMAMNHLLEVGDIEGYDFYNPSENMKW